MKETRNALARGQAMEDDWETPYEEGEELFYDDDGTFGVGTPSVEDSGNPGPYDRAH